MPKAARKTGTFLPMVFTSERADSVGSGLPAGRLVFAALVALAPLAVACQRGKQGTESRREQAPLKAAAGVQTPADAAPILMNGSSTVLPISEGVLQLYASRLVTDVTLEVAGTGGGFKLFCRGKTDINGASRPISPTESDVCAANGIRFIELPVAFDGVVVVVPKGNQFAEALTTAELKKVWAPGSQGLVRTWKEIRAGFPDEPLSLFGPGIDSGTFDFFTDAIVGEEGASRSDYRASESDRELADLVSKTPGALGYFGLSYYLANRDRLRALAIDDGQDDNGKGAVSPSGEAVMDGTYQPLSRPLFLYVAEKSLEREAVIDYVRFYVKSARLVAPDVGAVGLSPRLLELSLSRLELRVFGSAFSSLAQVVGLSFVDLLEAETVPVHERFGTHPTVPPPAGQMPTGQMPTGQMPAGPASAPQARALGAKNE